MGDVKRPAGTGAIISHTLNGHVLPQPSDVRCLMLHQHQSPAAGTKGLDANELTLFFAVGIQYDMDRITRDVLYLLYDIRVPILCRVCNVKFSAYRPSK